MELVWKPMRIPCEYWIDGKWQRRVDTYFYQEPDNQAASYGQVSADLSDGEDNTVMAYAYPTGLSNGVDIVGWGYETFEEAFAAVEAYLQQKWEAQS